MTILQPGGEEVPIQLKGPTEESQVLGVWSCPYNDGHKQLQYMLGKGGLWSSRVSSSTLSPSAMLGMSATCR